VDKPAPGPNPTIPEIISGRLQQCRTLEGKACQFPFRYLGETFNSCTTFDSANGAAWCKDIDGKYRDCAPPCGAAVSDNSCTSWEDCRNPGKECHGIEDVSCICKSGQCKISSACGTRGAFFYTACSSCSEDGCEDEGACQWTNGRCVDKQAPGPNPTIPEIISGRGNNQLQQCRTLEGKACQFPFRYKGQTFKSCTTFESENGAAWCTDIDGKYRDCAPSCGATVPVGMKGVETKCQDSSGTTREPGATWKEDCNTCSCLPNGQFICTIALCPPKTTVETKCQDSSGATREPGATWKEDCNTCSCLPDGQFICTLALCPPKTTGGMEVVGTKCQDSSGATREPGATWEEDCNTCSCLPSGQVGCTFVLCPPKTTDIDESCTSADDCYKFGKKCHGIQDVGCICKNGQCKISSGCGTHGAFFYTACSTCDEEGCEDEGACKWTNGKCGLI